MKHIATLITVLLFSNMANSQEPDATYQILWKNVEKLEQQALTKSALEIVKSISEKAKKEKNSVQTIKSLLYMSKYAMTLEEDAQLKIITEFKAEINKSVVPTRNILEGYLANLYWQYFQQNRYQFYNRTRTETKIDTLDFRTWDLTTLFEEIGVHFEKSLRNSEKLQKIRVAEFDALINHQKNSETYRPTLFNLLAHNALEFYKTKENSIVRPSYKFEIENSELLCEALPFLDVKLASKDSASLQLKALKTYQKLLRFHSNDISPEALAEVDIERLKFIYQNAFFEDKDQYYLEALQNSAARHRKNKVSALYNYEIALLYNQWGDTFNPKANQVHQWKKKDALELCSSVVKAYPESRGALLCKALKVNILSKNLQLLSEKHIPTNQPSKLLVKHKNHTDLQLSAYRISRNQIKKLSEIYETEKQFSFIKKLVLAKQWNAVLKNEEDYQPHSTEILLPALDVGSYIVLATSKNETKRAFAFSDIQVTNLAISETSTPENKYFQVIDRNNGRPLSKANVQFSYQKNYDGRMLKKTLVSDKKGFVKIPLSDKRWTNVHITVNHKDDQAYFGEYYLNSKYNQKNQNQVTNKCFLFTDRSIYRPGQIVYFKGILMETVKNSSNVLPKENVLASLHDVNGQKVSELDFETNEFGSFNGEFVLPSSGLTGEFYIQVYSVSGLVNENFYFSIEEYKRPKFETSFTPIKETYKVNDSVIVKGTAFAYAGSAITDAKVVYRVKRTVYFPRWYYWSRPYYNNAAQEITYGETVTDASGNYEIYFKAIPEKNTLKENLPVFSYEINADVTDINGETHSAVTTVRVGYHALSVNIFIDSTLHKDKKDNTVTVLTSNLNGEFIPAKGSLRIYKLKAPKYTLRNRPWEAPDYKSFTKEKFKELFPYDAYDNEDNSVNWEKGSLVLQTDFDTEKSTEISLRNSKKWVSGKYLIEVEAKDKFGQIIKEVKQTTLYSDKEKKLADQEFFRIKTDKNEYSVGDEVVLTLASSSKNLFVTVYLEKDRKIKDTYIVHLKDDAETLTFPVSEDDLGGFAITYSFSGYNSFLSNALNVYVPYPKTDLEIETIHFRDKLKPGTSETWTFKVKGPKGEKVSAELLAGMYDASLDAFKGHNWSFNPLYRSSYYTHMGINGYQSYGIRNFEAYNPIENYTFPQQFYDSFNWFGLNLGYGYRLYQRSEVMKNRVSNQFSMEALDDSSELEEIVVAGAPEGKTVGVPVTENDFNPIAEAEKQGGTNDGQIQVRKNLQETAFFLPKLQTDIEGNISFSFTTPEALTQWKLQVLAHTKDLSSSIITLNTLTQKELMVIPNAPRFLREGDNIVISTKIANLTEEALSGEAKLELIDAISGKDISNTLLSSSSPQEARQRFRVDSLGNTQVSWNMKMPEGLQAVQYKIIAKAGDFSDGEQHVLPVLTNRMLVTETLPMWVKSNQDKNFVLEKLRDNTSSTLKHHKLTLEMTSNPAWYAVQALPYLMEYPYDCNEQIFSRYYANTLASHIANSNPRIQEVFKQWANSDALMSNLEKNQELKSLLIQETPWLRDAQSETEQKKRIALLFNFNKMKQEQAIALSKLRNNQMSSGAWAWFAGGRANRFITQHIISGLGHLKHLNVSGQHKDNAQMVKKAMRYLDAEFIKEYEYMKKHATDLNDDHLSYTQIHYLYMRSFFGAIPVSKKVNDIMTYYY
ncbi:MAG: MG2 domain-containing protein, partial [Bacteroidota bacterium]